MISGGPKRWMASFIASMQKSASSVLEMRQASTLRVDQAIPLMVCRQTIAGRRMATRHRKPRRIGR
ncbi:MAG: hypothetical protein ACJAW4_002239 [Paracoccaceae bacterium]|jgi:hypothetical protein